MERLGLRASPQATLKALLEALRGARLKGIRVYLITDWQDRREEARYAVLIRTPRKDFLTPDAFGPAFPGGKEALGKLLEFLEEQGVEQFYEVVLPRSTLYALFESDDQEVLAKVLASANPADKGLFLSATHSAA
ncbi:MAG: DUF3197 domain-containing protein [Thermaceae bacterium]